MNRNLCYCYTPKHSHGYIGNEISTKNREKKEMKLIDKNHSRQNKIVCNEIAAATQEMQGIEIHKIKK